MLLNAKGPNVNRARNTGWFGVGDPILRASGLGGLGDATTADSTQGGTDAGGFFSSLATMTPMQWTQLNSEVVFANNLVRQDSGLAPLSISAASPSVAVAVDPQTLLLGGGILLALVMAMGGKRKKRRK